MKTEPAWREASADYYMQAIRFGHQSIRPYLARALRLLTVDINARRSAEYIMDHIPNRTEEKDSMKDTTKDPHERVTDEEEKKKNTNKAQGRRSICTNAR